MADILAVDDQEEWLELYSEKLAEMGHTVRAYTKGQVALNETGGRRPDLVILDLRMAPSGRQMLWMIQRYWPGVPVIISTAYGGYRDDPDFARAAAFFEKSTDMAKFGAIVEHVLNRAGLGQESLPAEGRP
jgi:DNA-binding NtrC family response regulator